MVGAHSQGSVGFTPGDPAHRRGPRGPAHARPRPASCWPASASATWPTGRRPACPSARSSALEIARAARRQAPLPADGRAGRRPHPRRGRRAGRHDRRRAASASTSPSCSSSTTWRWSCASRTRWWRWTSGARSPTARPRHVRADPAVHPGLPGERPHEPAGGRGLHAGYGPVEVSARARPRGQRRRGRRDARRQRRRQDDDDAGVSRHDPAPRHRSRFDGTADRQGRPADQIVRLGVAQVPQGRGTFPTLSVEDNLARRRLRAPRPRRRSQADRAALVRGLPRPRRARARSAPAACRAASSRCWPIARALMSRPKLLLLRRAEPRPRPADHPARCSTSSSDAQPRGRACRCCSSSRTPTSP